MLYLTYWNALKTSDAELHPDVNHVSVIFQIFVEWIIIDAVDFC